MFGIHGVRMSPDSSGGVAIACLERGETGYNIRYARILAGGKVLYNIAMIGGLIGSTLGVAQDVAGGAYFGYHSGGDVYLNRIRTRV